MRSRRHHFILPLAALALTAAPGLGADKDFTDKDIPKSKFADEMLNRAKFDRANLEWADFTNALLKTASFRGANLRHAVFRKANMEGADFSGAKLEGAVFTDAKAWNANFSKTEIHLLRATLDALKAEDILGQFADKSNGALSFRNSNMRDAVILGDAGGVDFRGVDFRGANLSGATNLEKASFKGAQFDETTRWNLDVEKAGAVRVKSEAPLTADVPKKSPEMKKGDIVNSPFAGTWLIYRDIEDPKTGGELQCSPDHTFTWKPLSSEAKILSGKWADTKEDQMAIAEGELGKAWSVRRVVRANGKSYLELKTGDGEKRIALPR